jgi:purine-binding chemotaxis protein CheW
VSTALERYFEQRVTLPEESEGAAFTEAERAFLTRYLGADYKDALARDGLARPAAVESVTGPLDPAPSAPAPETAAPEAEATDGLEARLRQASELKLVGFHVAGQELSVPIAQVQEVIRAVPVTRLPTAPVHILGIMNLRGRVVPLIDTAGLLGLAASGQSRFIIVCRRRDMLLGLLVEAIAAMHQARGEDVEWNVEARVGVAPDLIAGLLKAREVLVKILSVDSLFQKVLKS